MTITGAIVIFAMTWFMVFFVMLSIRVQTQQASGEVVPGTPSSAPAGFVVARKAKITTVVTIVIWALICGIILSGWITVEDFDLFTRLNLRLPKL